MENPSKYPTQLREYWEENYQKFLNRPSRDSDWKLKAICYQPWPLLFNRVMDFFERYYARDLMRRFAPSLEGKKVLDLGCGVGRWSRFFQRYGGEVVGVDLVWEVLVENRRQFSRPRFCNMAASDLGFKNETFDFVSAPIVLQHIPPLEKARALDEIYRVLKPGGAFFLLETIARARKGDQETSWLLQEAEWREALESRGFEIVHQRPLHGYPLAALYSLLMLWLGKGVRRLKSKSLSSTGPKNPPEKVSTRHTLYYHLNQGALSLIALLSFPLEFLWVGLRLGGNHQMFLIKKS